jgi:hypothetical protein
VKVETDGGERVYAFTRVVGKSAVLVAVNFGDEPVRLTYRGLTAAGAFTDAFARATVRLKTDGALDVAAHGYRVLVR